MKELWKNGTQYSLATAGAISEILEDYRQTCIIWKFNKLVEMVESWKKMKAASIIVVSVAVGISNSHCSNHAISHHHEYSVMYL